MRIGVLTSGGDAPGMNAVLHSVVRAGIGRGHEVLGIQEGYKGLLAGNAKPLSQQDADGISRYGGTMLGSARSKVFPTDEGQAQAKAQIKKLGLDALLVIGGNGSLTGAHKIAQDGDLLVVGLPASIDNDIGHCGLAIGVDTAVNTIVEACDRISDTAKAHHRAFIVEVMGRSCGYLAMRSGIASEADAILFAERNRPEEEVVAHLREVMQRSFAEKRDKKRVLIIKAEGVKVPTQTLVDRLQEHLDEDAPGVDIRATILGHVVRGGAPSAMDRVIGQRLGLAALFAFEAGLSDVMLGWETPDTVGEATKDPSIRATKLDEMLQETEELLNGKSPVTKARIQLLETVENLLSL
ncbi:MAG: 6-phosphofructokinase [Deltaproteobacteria bacterium]|nr:6-phosphofructokinase [Deltaproteobacteria bacterium]